MFDKLVESTKDRKQGRTSRIVLMTGLVYAMLIVVIAVSTILGLNPGLAESYDVTMIAPPPPGEQPQPVVNQRIPQNSTRTQSPDVVPNQLVKVATPEIFDKFPRPEIRANAECHGCAFGGNPNAVVIGGKEGSEEPPEPPPAPKVKPTPEPTPEVKPTPPQVLKVSTGVAQGLAIRKVSPQYPAIAKAARISGAVQVQVLISEDGRVLNAGAVSGHPLLRDAALDAARQWLFKPTTLSEVPVKVQGVLTFNFALN